MKITNKKNLPDVLMQACQAYQKKYEDGKMTNLSVTDLLKPPLMRRLEKEFDSEIEEDLTDRIWALTGQALHEVLAKNKVENTLTEERLKITIHNVEVSGQFDMYFASGLLQDYKFTNVWKIIYNDFEDWILQLNIYRYLLIKAGFEVNKLQIVAILRDWQKTKASREENYPGCQVKIIDIDLLPIKEIELYLNERVQFHLYGESIPIEKIEICSKKERWHQDDKYALMKEGRKSAVLLFDNEKDCIRAVDDYNAAGDTNLFYLEERRGKDTRCELYCRASKHCPYYKKILEEQNGKN